MNINNAFSANFKNYFELSACVDKYNSFTGYKNKLNECFKNQGIEVDRDSFKLIEKKPIVPSKKEISLNSPSRSAKLRYATKLNNNYDFSELIQKFNYLLEIENLSKKL